MSWNSVPDDVDGMRRRALFDAFTPAAPVDRKEVFSGRVPQLGALQEVLLQKGQHAVIYGERGVGKTSLAKVAREMAAVDEMFTAHVTCDSSDTFDSIWRKVLGEISIVNDDNSTDDAMSMLNPDAPVTPNVVRVVLQQLSLWAPVVAFIDEFDVVDNETKKASAETIKVLSDQGVNATIVLVGVAESVTELISEHQSTERNLIQVPMPRMTVAERREIIEQGLKRAEMTIDSAAESRIVLLSQGLAQFVHLLAQRAALIALSRSETHVDVDHVTKAIEIALQDTHASVQSGYYTAVKSNQVTLYPAVLLACALAEADERGFFSAKALVDPISKITGKDLSIPAFGPHLDRLSSTRGPVLLKEGEKRSFRYRFVNPLMQPFVLMRGVTDQMVDFAQISMFKSVEKN